jgi:hypothetical protein
LQCVATVALTGVFSAGENRTQALTDIAALLIRHAALDALAIGKRAWTGSVNIASLVEPAHLRRWGGCWRLCTAGNDILREGGGSGEIE